jgi:FXSXX-COOH protein
VITGCGAGRHAQLLTIATLSPNLSMKAVDDRALPGKEPVVENVSAPVHSCGSPAVALADLREVPLAQLPGDVDVHRIVSLVIRILEDSSRTDVARFNSSI